MTFSFCYYATVLMFFIIGRIFTLLTVEFSRRCVVTEMYWCAWTPPGASSS